VRENRIYLFEVDGILRTRRIAECVRLEGLQQIADGVSGKAGDNVPQNEQVVVEIAFLVVLEVVFQVFNAVQSPIG
jgi:hypothetical protein